MMKIHAYSLEAINYVAYVIQLDEVGPFGLCRVDYRARVWISLLLHQYSLVLLGIFLCKMFVFPFATTINYFPYNCIRILSARFCSVRFRRGLPLLARDGYILV